MAFSTKNILPQNYFSWYSIKQYLKRFHIGGNSLKKRSIAWVVDSTAYISDDLRHHPDFYSVPLNIHVEGKQFVDGQDLSSEQLYQKIQQMSELPKTSQPSVGIFAELFEKLKNEYEHAVCIHISAKLSGTLASAKAAADLTDFPIALIDSRSLSCGITAMIEKGMALEEQGASFEAIQHHLEKMAGSSHNYIVIGKLDQLYKGGRMSSVQFYLGSLLKIKPIIQISSEGSLEAIEKVRSEKKALQYLVDKTIEGHHPCRQKIYIMHGNALEKAEALRRMIQEVIPDIEIVIGDIGSIIAVHAGEGTVATFWFDEA